MSSSPDIRLSINRLAIVAAIVVMQIGWASAPECQGQVLNRPRLSHAALQVVPEQRTIRYRSPESLPRLPVYESGIPFTVIASEETREPQKISLDEAIQIAVRNAEVVRVLTGVGAASSGRTIYDVAISNAGIDLQTSVFDPTFTLNSTMNKTDRAVATFDPFNPGQSLLTGSSSDSINTTVGLSKRNFSGATVGLNANAVGSYFEPGVFPLEPEYRSFAEVTLRQPLMRGYGRDVNFAPIMVARIDTERSYFQFKDSMQELVRGVIAAYWNLVAARVNVWARQQQIAQSEFAYKRAVARQEEGLDRAADVAQTRSALANFKAALIAARSNELLAETALRNILQLPPSNTSVLVPTSLPLLEKVDFDWNEIVALAEIYRPDLIELKLVLEADRLRLLQTNNQARPQFDGLANYRWDGLSGEMPNGLLLRNDPGRFAGFNLGVNFSVPIGLRQDRANLRRQELIIARDQANIEQGTHQVVHQLTVNYRNLDQFFEQYIAFKEARAAARINFENQSSEFAVGSREFINVLQAINDWGNAVSQEAQSITQYNTELANVERQTGTILETHGIRFVEEQYGSLEPRLLGVRRSETCYPSNLRGEGSTDRYAESNQLSDEAFNLENLDFEREPSLDLNDNELDDEAAEAARLRERIREESEGGSAVEGLNVPSLNEGARLNQGSRSRRSVARESEGPSDTTQSQPARPRMTRRLFDALKLRR